MLGRNRLGNSLLVEVKFELRVIFSLAVNNVEAAVEIACDEVIRVAGTADAELVEDALIFVEFAEFALKRFENGDVGDGLVGHVDVPDLDVEEISREDVASILGP